MHATYLFNIRCKCGFLHKIRVNEEQVKQIKNGANVLDVITNLSQMEKHLIRTKVCPSCWDRMFNKGERE